MFREKSSSETQINYQESCEKCGSTQSSSKESDNPWITSGSIGSKDAVLVFRTSVFSVQQKDDSDSQSTSSSLNTQISSGLDTKDDFNHISATKDKVLFSLPKNSSQINIKSNINKEMKIKPIITSPKKRLHESLSSSDNSISSECDDPTEMEESLVKIANDSQSSAMQSQNNKNDVSGMEGEATNCSKHVSFDDKENINDSDDTEIPQMPATELKITYKLLNSETKLLKKIFVGHGLMETEHEQQFNILWTGVHVKPDILRNLTPYQRVNHFPRSYELTRKDRLYKNIVKMQHLRGYKHFDIVPQSFILPLEYRDLVSAHNKCRGPWIVKPAASSRGRGIFIVNSPDQIQMEDQILVSKYIADPLCIDGHKCDLRVYVAVTSYDPLVIYVYEEGLVRLATVKYDRNAENLWNPCMHLCNYSINKYHSDYIKSNDAGDEDVGHKWTLSALLRHLKSQGCDITQLMSNIEDLIIKSVFACAQSIISACRMFVPSGNNCFELYGFDILIDDSLKPWLLEVNLSPSLGIDSPLDARVKASLVTDLLTLVGIPAFSPTMRLQYDSKWSRIRSYSCGRRANSADHLNSSGKKVSNQSKTLSSEEARVVKNAKLQYARRGGFVRIFPSSESMQRYGSFLDPVTGIPLSTTPASGSGAFPMMLSHNYNHLLFNQLFGENPTKNTENIESRMQQYERALETSEINLGKKKQVIRCLEEGKRLKKQIRRLIEGGHELTQFQARQAFGLYLECILRRLSQEPRSHHEKLILKFINRVSDNFKAPLFFQNPLNYHITGKDRSAMVAKLLGDFLQTYNRDTEAYDTFDNYSMIPAKLFNEFLSQAQESDLETILTLHTNLTQCMPYLYSRCGLNVPPTPPIPTGVYGFLKALPSMVPGGYSRDQTKIDSYYKIVDSKEAATSSEKKRLEVDKSKSTSTGKMKSQTGKR